MLFVCHFIYYRDRDGEKGEERERESSGGMPQFAAIKMHKLQADFLHLTFGYFVP